MAQLKFCVCAVTRKLILEEFMKNITIISILRHGSMRSFCFIFLKNYVVKQ